MSETKCCGNCAHSYGKDMDGYCACGIDNHFTSCDEVCDKHIMSINGWTEITPDNVEDLFPVIDRVMVAYKLGEGLAGYSSLTELYKPLKDLALTGGYYYIVLPELKIE